MILPRTKDFCTFFATAISPTMNAKAILLVVLGLCLKEIVAQVPCTTNGRLGNANPLVNAMVNYMNSYYGRPYPIVVGGLGPVPISGSIPISGSKPILPPGVIIPNNSIKPIPVQPQNPPLISNLPSGGGPITTTTPGLVDQNGNAVPITTSPLN